MTTAEKAALGIAFAGALGAGALLKSWMDHVLGRTARRIGIAEKSIQIAEALMTRMEAELTRAQEALARAEREAERLRAEQARTTDLNPEDSIRVMSAKRKLRAAETELANAHASIQGIQAEFGEMRAKGGLGRGLAVLIPVSPQSGSSCNQ